MDQSDFYLKVIFLVDFTLRNFILNLQCRVTHLRWQTKLQVEQASLTNVLKFRASLANFRFLESHSSARAPAEDCERSRTDLAFLSVSLLQHADIWIVAETRLAENRKLLKESKLNDWNRINDSTYAILPIGSVVG